MAERVQSGGVTKTERQMGIPDTKIKKWFTMDKKGVIEDIPITIALLFALFIVFIVLHKAYTEIHDSMTLSGAVANGTRAATILQNGQTMMNLFDFVFVSILIILFIGLLYFSFQQDSHPIFFFLTLFLMIATIIIAAAFSNAVDSFLGSGSADVFDNQSASFPMSGYIFDHLPLFVAIIMGIGAILLYGKLRLR